MVVGSLTDWFALTNLRSFSVICPRALFALGGANSSAVLPCVALMIASALRLSFTLWLLQLLSLNSSLVFQSDNPPLLPH